MTTSIPLALSETFSSWDTAGRPAPAASPWHRAAWEKRNITVPAALTDMPISRDTVAKFAAEVAADDLQSQRDAFITTMIWGYGTVSYGPHRLSRILQQPGFDSQLQELTMKTIESGGVAGYQLVYDRRRSHEPFLKHLGSAFGTKYLYFVSQAHCDRPTPILDSVVLSWFRENAADVNVQAANWFYPSRYGRFVDTVHEWGEQLKIRPDQVEHLIFAQQQSESGGGRWSEPWLTDRTQTANELLAQLQSALAAKGLADLARQPLADLEKIIDQHG